MNNELYAFLESINYDEFVERLCLSPSFCDGVAEYMMKQQTQYSAEIEETRNKMQTIFNKVTTHRAYNEMADPQTQTNILDFKNAHYMGVAMYQIVNSCCGTFEAASDEIKRLLALPVSTSQLLFFEYGAKTIPLKMLNIIVDIINTTQGGPSISLLFDEVDILYETADPIYNDYFAGIAGLKKHNSPSFGGTLHERSPVRYIYGTTATTEFNVFQQFPVAVSLPKTYALKAATGNAVNLELENIYNTLWGSFCTGRFFHDHSRLHTNHCVDQCV